LKILKIALIGAGRPNFSEKSIELYAKASNDIKKLSENFDFELVIYKDILNSEKKIEEGSKEYEIINDLNNKNFDFVLIFHSTYVSGDFIFEILKTKPYFGFWAITEPTQQGPLPLASLVSLNQNTSIAKHFFLKNKKKIKWFFGDVENKYFKPRFEITIKALIALKNLKNSKICQIGKIPDGFKDLYFDERRIFKNLGIEIVRGIEIEDVLRESEKLNNKIILQETEKIKQLFSNIEARDTKIVDSIKIYFVLKKICEENNFKALGFSCWPKLRVLKQLTPCLSLSMLNSSGIPTACEADILGAISMYLLYLLSLEKPVSIMDLPAFDEKDNSILLWHCGMAPFEMASRNNISCCNHYRAYFAKDEVFKELGPIVDMSFLKGDTTVFRLIGEGNYYYYFTGKIFNENKKAWDGSHGWINDLKLFRKPINAIDLMNTILLNDIPHHYPFVLSNLEKYIEEFAYWANLKKVKRLDYEDYIYE
jgi:L-fucose isomerase-like protein